MSNPPLTGAGPSGPASGLRPFTRTGWELLVKLPGQVLVAATVVETETARYTVAEGLAGLDAVAAGRNSVSRLVQDVVRAIYHQDDDALAAAVPGVRPAGSRPADLLATCRAAAVLLRAHAHRVDAEAYRYWLESIAARVYWVARMEAGFGRDGLGTPAEWRMLRDLHEAFE